jgi:uncharacterized protein (DUF1697 family)
LSSHKYVALLRVINVGRHRRGVTARNWNTVTRLGALMDEV